MKTFYFFTESRNLITAIAATTKKKAEAIFKEGYPQHGTDYICQPEAEQD